MMPNYDADLSYIHHAGFAGFAENSAAGILALLRDHGISSGLVIDLGCGSGIWANKLAHAGYQVLGIDQSKAMIELARERAPGVSLRVGSFLSEELPRSEAVTAVGEVFNYLFDPGNTEAALFQCFARIYEALRPGGVFVFDLAGPGRVPPPGTQRTFTVGDDWAILFEAKEDSTERLLTRWMTTFRKVGELYRRGEEVHHLRLYHGSDIVRALEKIGFEAQVLPGYGDMKLAAGHNVFCARKP